MRGFNSQSFFALAVALGLAVLGLPETYQHLAPWCLKGAAVCLMISVALFFRPDLPDLIKEKIKLTIPIAIMLVGLAVFSVGLIWQSWPKDADQAGNVYDDSVYAYISCEVTYWGALLPTAKPDKSYFLYNMTDGGGNRILSQLFSPSGDGLKFLGISPFQPIYKCTITFYGERPLFDVRVMMEAEVKTVVKMGVSDQKNIGPFADLHTSMTMSGNVTRAEIFPGFSLLPPNGTPRRPSSFLNCSASCASIDASF